MVYFTSRNDRSLSNPNSLWKNWDNLAQQFDSFFADFDKGNSSEINRSERSLVFAPATDVEESSTHYDLSFDMPGMKEEDLNVELDGRTLTVSGKRERQVTDTKNHRSEKFYGEYRRTISLPDNIKGEEIQASYDNGVLSIKLPKAQLTGAKKIQIGTRSADKASLESQATH